MAPPYGRCSQLGARVDVHRSPNWSHTSRICRTFARPEPIRSREHRLLPFTAKAISPHNADGRTHRNDHATSPLVVADIAIDPSSGAVIGFCGLPAIRPMFRTVSVRIICKSRNYLIIWWAVLGSNQCYPPANPALARFSRGCCVIDWRCVIDSEFRPCPDGAGRPFPSCANRRGRAACGRVPGFRRRCPPWPADHAR